MHRFGRGAAAAASGLAVSMVAACGPSPVDMVEHPITATPSRAAGEALHRSADPEESCFEEHVPPASDGTREVGSIAPGSQIPGVGGGDGENGLDEQVGDENGDDDPGDLEGSGLYETTSVDVPGDPQRILAVGLAAVDTACLIGLEDRVVGTGPLPDDADLYLPPELTSLPRLDPEAVDFVSEAATLRPDVITLPASQADADLVDSLEGIAPTVVYDDTPFRWGSAVEHVGDVFGRPNFAGDALLYFLSAAENVRDYRATWDTQVSVVRFDGAEPSVVPPDTFGISVLEAAGATRPPAQRAENGVALDPEPGSPIASDELSGDLVIVLIDNNVTADAAARDYFGTERWQELPPVENNRVWMVDRAVWEGGGLVAARNVLDDISETINSHAPDG